MKTITIVTVFLIIAFVASADATEYRVRMKNGSEMIWSNYTELEGQYCTNKHGGMICISKDEITSINEEVLPEDAIVIYNPGMSAEERETERYKQECDELRAKLNRSIEKTKMSDSIGSALNQALETKALRNTYESKCLTPAQQEERRAERNKQKERTLLRQMDQKLDRIENKLRYGY